MEFQVVSAKRLPRFRAGRSRIVFYFCGDMEAMEAGIKDRKTDAGIIKVSSTVLTAPDLLRFPRATGGVGHIASILSGLGQEIHPKRLVSCPINL